jgi:RNA polymerase sigma factor (sigma-70 family)
VRQRQEEDVSAAHWDSLEAHRQALTAFLRGRCPSQGDVEDCVQEAMLRVAQMPEVDPLRVRGLLTTVANNVAMDMHRDRARQAAACSRMGATHSPGADALALDSCEARRLADHARHLSPRERAALGGRADGFAPREIAELLGDTPRSIHLALSRARTSLRRLAEAAGALVPWMRRRGRGSLRLTAPTVVAVTLGLAILGPRLAVPLGGSHPAAAPPPVVAAAGPHGASTIAPPRPAHEAPGRAVTASPAAVAVAGPDRHTIVRETVGSPQLVQASVGVVEVNPNQPLLTGIQDCLKPGAVSLDPQHAGCAG